MLAESPVRPSSANPARPSHNLSINALRDNLVPRAESGIGALQLRCLRSQLLENLSAAAYLRNNPLHHGPESVALIVHPHACPSRNPRPKCLPSRLQGHPLFLTRIATAGCTTGPARSPANSCAGTTPPPSHKWRESSLNLRRRTVNLWCPERARNEGSTVPNQLSHFLPGE